MNYVVISCEEMREFVKEQILLTKVRSLKSSINEAISNIDDLFDKKGIVAKLEKGELK